MAIYWVTLTIPVEAEDSDDAFRQGNTLITKHLCESSVTKELYGEIDNIQAEEDKDEVE